ncbi:MAG: lysophospholipase [Robiginitalea sp.]|jgi:acylglycerol lipase
MSEIRRETFSAVWEEIPVHGYWRTPKDPEGMVILVHGFGEHSGRYKAEVVPFFNKHGLGVFAFDLVGHGRSGGKRGDCAGYDQLMHLVDKACRTARERFPKLPLLLFGHSMGGNLVLNYALRGLGRPDGILASSPYLRLAFQPPAWKWQFGKLLERLFPSITVGSGLDPNGISRDPREVETYLEDPLIHDRVSPRYSFPVIEAGEWALANAADLEVPTLVLHGTADPIIDSGGSMLFCQRAPGCDLVLIEKGYHELHRDLDRDRYFAAIEDWLSQNFPYRRTGPD